MSTDRSGFIRPFGVSTNDRGAYALKASRVIETGFLLSMNATHKILL